MSTGLGHRLTRWREEWWDRREQGWWQDLLLRSRPWLLFGIAMLLFVSGLIALDAYDTENRIGIAHRLLKALGMFAGEPAEIDDPLPLGLSITSFLALLFTSLGAIFGVAIAVHQGFRDLVRTYGRRPYLVVVGDGPTAAAIITSRSARHPHGAPLSRAESTLSLIHI